MTRILVLSASVRPQSTSERLGALCAAALARGGVTVTSASLREFPLPAFDDREIYASAAFDVLFRRTAAADGIVLCSPTYNWSTGSELKKYIECVGSSDATRRGALFDKTIAFVNAGGLPHSYMAFGALAVSLMLDFKCVINPYNVYVHDACWTGDVLIDASAARLQKAMDVMVELTQLLAPRTYVSNWEI